MKTILLLITFIVCTKAKSQTFEYAYDDAGNRVQRAVLVMHMGHVDTSLNQTVNNVNVSLQPNPTAGFINVTISSSSTDNTATSLLLFDLNGKQLQTVNNASTSNTLDLSGYANGIYYLNIVNGKKKKQVKIIKQ